MKQQVLSIEQMIHLQELGVDTSGASMMYHFWVDKKYKNCFLLSADTATPYDSENVPTFTLQDMLEMIRENCDDNGIVMNITAGYFQTWKVYVEICKKHFKHNQLEIFENQELLLCVYDAFCWLAENGYLKGGENERK